MRIRWMMLCPLVAASLSWAGPLQRRVGIYHWGGRATVSMSEGVERIARLGGRVARVALSSRHFRDYNLDNKCYPDYSLTAIAQEPDVKRALDNDSIDVFILTAYDGATFADCDHPRFLDPSFYTPEATRAMFNEYSDFTLYLYRTYQRTYKRFIITNWEGDNSIYCQSAYDYAVSPPFRAYCDANYQKLYGTSSPAESFQGLKLWLQVRQQGIADGRNRAAAEGIGGMRVYFAPEFSVVRALHDRGLPSVLYDVIPSIIFDFVSYSAYESINMPDVSAALTADLNEIRDVVGSTALIVGEAGFARSAWGEQAMPRTVEVVNAALNWGVAYIVLWNLYDQDPRNNFGFYDLDGNITLLIGCFNETLDAALDNLRHDSIDGGTGNLSK